MIRKLSNDQKVDWPRHLPELGKCLQLYEIGQHQVQPTLIWCWGADCAYPFTHWLLLPYDEGHREHQYVEYCIAELCEWLWEAFKEAQAQFISEAERQKQYYDRKANAISLEPGDLTLAKANAYKEKRKVKDQWEEEPYEVECQVAGVVPSCLMKNQQTGQSWVLQWDWLFSLLPQRVPLLCMVVWAEQSRYATATLEWDWGSTMKCELPAACPAAGSWDSFRMDEQETLCIPLDIYQSIPTGTRVKSSM